MVRAELLLCDYVNEVITILIDFKHQHNKQLFNLVAATCAERVPSSTHITCRCILFQNIIHIHMIQYTFI